MKTIEIVGDNYFGKWNNTRTACRAVVIKDGKILLSYETKTDQWIIPGGGLEYGENDNDCCVREVAEETGYLVKPSECVLQIEEYYEGFKYVNKYFTATVIGTTETNLTEREREVGMEPRWLEVDKFLDIVSKHADFADIDEMRRGAYLQQYTALSEMLNIK